MQVIIVDLDKKHVVRSMGDELTLLPKKVQKALKTAINMCRIDSGETRTHSGGEGGWTLARPLSSLVDFFFFDFPA